MIGNDVIDISLAKRESNWKRKGYLDKIFTADEQELIFASDDPDFTVWKLWSMKESAYKAYNRITGERSYNPLKLQCTINPVLEKIDCGRLTLFSCTTLDGDCLHTIALSHNNFDGCKIVNLPAIKRNGLPFIQKNGKEYPASVSHHGRFAISIALLDAEPGL